MSIFGKIFITAAFVFWVCLIVSEAEKRAGHETSYSVVVFGCISFFTMLLMSVLYVWSL